MRELVLEDTPGLGIDDVLITGGAAGALFIIATALLGPDDHLVLVKPNYATNLETPRAVGCNINLIDLAFEQGFALDFGRLASAVTPRTRLVSVTCPPNPTREMLLTAELRRPVTFAPERGRLLFL